MSLSRALRLVGWTLFVVAGAIVVAAPGPARMFVPFAIAYVCMGIAFAVATPTAPRSRRIGSLAVQTVAISAMAFAEPCRFTSLFVVLVAFQGAQLFSIRALVPWLAIATTIAFVAVHRQNGFADTLAWAMAITCLQTFAVVTVRIGHGEAEGRQALAAANAALLATRAELAAQSRERERLRIARDLHDVLGHDLTALNLQLEVARNVVNDERGQDHVTRAHEMSKQLLTDVRAVVGAMRERPTQCLDDLLSQIAASMPHLAVHFERDDGIDLGDPERRECVLRCVQEIVTNTARHTAAQNVWITLRDRDGELLIEGRDDGRTSGELKPGLGFAGMRERLELLGGSLELGSAPAQPLVVRARLPRFA